MAQPLVSLRQACEELDHVVDLATLVFFSETAGKRLAKKHTEHQLSAAECGAIHLYTADSDFYPKLNQALRNRDRNAVKPWLKYLRLLFSAVGKLPAFSSTVWRGIQLPDEQSAERYISDLEEKKADEDTLFWWGSTRVRWTCR
eukprot:g1799.t1